MVLCWYSEDDTIMTAAQENEVTTMIIDFHIHTFPDKIASRTINMLATKCRTKPNSDGTLSAQLDSMKRSGVDWSVAQPVMTKPEQTGKLNAGFIANRDQYLSQGIIPFGGMHPENENYKEEIDRLRDGGILGIKLHPAYQCIPFDDIRFMRIIDYACEQGLIVLTHAGWDIGIYDQNYCSVPQVLNVINTVHPNKLVLAHMGGWADWENVEKYLAGAPVWFDTAFSIGPITALPGCSEPPIKDENLSDEDFIRLARKHGTDKVLFATDYPWADQTDYVQRIQDMALTDEEKEQILGGNALALLGDGFKA